MTTAMTGGTPQFSGGQWVEIYNALLSQGDPRVRNVESRLIKKFAPDGDAVIQSRGVSKGRLKSLDSRDYAVMYNAVWHKLNPWLYSGDKQWHSELVEILDALSGYGHCEMCGAIQGRVHQDGRGLVTLHRTSCWEGSDGRFRRVCMVCRDGLRQLYTREGEHKQWEAGRS